MKNLLYAEAMLGADAQEFVASDVGRYIIGRAEQDASEAADKLKRVSPWRRKRIVELQNDIYRAESIQSWIVEMIQSGISAEHALEQD